MNRWCKTGRGSRHWPSTSTTRQHSSSRRYVHQYVYMGSLALIHGNSINCLMKGAALCWWFVYVMHAQPIFFRLRLALKYANRSISPVSEFLVVSDWNILTLGIIIFLSILYKLPLAPHLLYKGFVGFIFSSFFFVPVACLSVLPFPPDGSCDRLAC